MFLKVQKPIDSTRILKTQTSYKKESFQLLKLEEWEIKK